MKYKALLIMVLLLIVLIGGCSLENSRQSNADEPRGNLTISPRGNLTILYSIYSGRTSPQWDVTDQSEINIIKEKIKGLPLLENPNKSRYSMGGFLIFSVKGWTNIPDSAFMIAVYPDAIIMYGEGKVYYFEDQNCLWGYIVKLAEEQKSVISDAHAKRLLELGKYVPIKCVNRSYTS